MRTKTKKTKNNKKILKKQRNGKEPEFKMPKWMECTWRRVPCNKDSCPICGRIKQDHKRHVAKGEDLNSMGSALEDVGKTFKEVLTMIKADCEAKGIDISSIDDIQEPPEPIEFPLYNKVSDWQNKILAIVDYADEREEIWLYSETAQDLTWYANLLSAKTYRQLCNRWHIKMEDGYGDFDFEYTQKVLGECLRITKESLAELASYDTGEKINFVQAYNELMNLEKKILDI